MTEKTKLLECVLPYYSKGFLLNEDRISIVLFKLSDTYR